MGRVEEDPCFDPQRSADRHAERDHGTSHATRFAELTIHQGTDCRKRVFEWRGRLGGQLSALQNVRLLSSLYAGKLASADVETDDRFQDFISTLR